MSGLRAAVLIAACVAATAAHAGGPRFVTGSVGYGPAGSAMPFYTSQPLYYTDPGDLSPTITHAQADAMVADAAAVWNVAPASLILQQGGSLDEHVSSANAYFDGTNFVFPADVQATNYLAKPIAVLYDTDGSLTDLLLGQGASNPEGCRQNAVTESVDSFGANATIQHALILLNGRCIDSTSESPQQLLQMQYLVMRAFGRVLGLSWSQLNDNAFTGSPEPTIYQMQNWPVMHPLDVICGPYSYQCMTDPFALRTDDISALTYLYPNYGSSFPAGKVSTSLDAVYIWGPVTFPTGQQAEMVNVQMQRWQANQSTWELVPIVSSVSGFQFQQNGGNPVTGSEDVALNAGADYSPAEGVYYMPWIPIGPLFINVQTETVPINPLYIGEFAVGAYQRPVISMPGTQDKGNAWTLGPGQINKEVPLLLADAPASCNPGNDGTEAGPAAADPTGWWSGLLCSTGHSSWFTTTVRANHIWTLEATALDEGGNATINKAQPMLGVWDASDPTGTLPTIGATSSAMNAAVFGLTQLHVAAATADTPVRLVVADQFGAGRPDFTYKARIFYLDSVAPASVPTTGGKITLTGTGFRLGNTVRINGVLATALSWTSTQIVVQTPTQAAANAGSPPVDILVTDTATGATTSIPAALTFTGPPPPPVLAVSIATPTAYIAAGAAGQWTVTLNAMEDTLPAAAAPVVWSAPIGFALTSPQSATGTNGTASTLIGTPAAPAGTSTLTACAWTSVCAIWTVSGVPRANWVAAATGGAAQAIHSTQTLAPVTFTVTDTAGHLLPGAPVTLYQTAYAWQGPCTTARCPAAPVLATNQTTVVADANGQTILAPLQVPNTAQTVAIAAATGDAGFATTTLTITP